MIFSFLIFYSYVFPAHWKWANKGYLRALGVVDISAQLLRRVDNTVEIVIVIVIKLA